MSSRSGVRARRALLLLTVLIPPSAPWGDRALLASEHTLAPRYAAGTPNPAVHRLDEVYFLQPHQSFERAERLTGWLDLGFRALELDVLDRGSWEEHADGPYVSHGPGPGQQNCSHDGDTRLGHCLRDVLSWIDRNPGNTMPILILIDMKTTSPASWRAEEIVALDDRIQTLLGARLYTFGDLYDHLRRQGTGSPRLLLSGHGWPTLESLRGRLIVALTGGLQLQVNQGMSAALDLYLDSDGRLPGSFFCPDVESDPEELDVDGVVDGMRPRNSGYVVCSNLRSTDHYQVTANRAARNKQLLHLWGNHVMSNLSFAYNYVAVAHGVSIVGQDLRSFAQATTFGDSIPFVGLRRSLPGYFRLRPTAARETCLTVAGPDYEDGAGLVSRRCGEGSGQSFVYTAEAQLRPRGDNRYCVDIEGGSGGSRAKLHLWDCDGGDSEKWVVDPGGFFKSCSGGASCRRRIACMEGDSADGGSWRTSFCSANSDRHRFLLDAVSDWQQTAF